jgi:hypothetical protein
MAQRNTFAHFLHDAGLAVWFGGTLAGAVAVNGAAADVDDPRQRARVANAGWARWTPVNAVAIGAHLLGGAQLLRANKGRVVAQKHVLGNTNAKLALTGAALGATAYARLLGKKLQAAGDVPVDGGTTPRAETPPEVAKAQKQLAALQWAIPALTGGIFVSSALHEEQQRPSEVLRGTVKALPDTLSHAAAIAGAAIVPAVASARAAAAPVVKDAGERAVEAAGQAKVALTPYAKEAAHQARDARKTLAPYAKDARTAVTPLARDAAAKAREAQAALAPYAKDASEAAKSGFETARAKAKDALPVG